MLDCIVEESLEEYVGDWRVVAGDLITLLQDQVHVGPDGHRMAQGQKLLKLKCNRHR